MIRVYKINGREGQWGFIIDCFSQYKNQANVESLSLEVFREQARQLCLWMVQAGRILP